MKREILYLSVLLLFSLYCKGQIGDTICNRCPIKIELLSDKIEVNLQENQVIITINVSGTEFANRQKINNNMSVSTSKLGKELFLKIMYEDKEEYESVRLDGRDAMPKYVRITNKYNNPIKHTFKFSDLQKTGAFNPQKTSYSSYQPNKKYGTYYIQVIYGRYIKSSRKNLFNKVVESNRIKIIYTEAKTK